jgi:hypothetical protein
MSPVEVGEFEKRDIRNQVDRILRDLGHPDPPLNLRDVRDLLKLDLQFYSRSDPGLIAEITHRFHILARKSLPDLGKHLLTALSKSRLCAFWVPESSRILIDADEPRPRHRWIEAHEITHSVTPWHKHYLLGDNAETLLPECRAALEAEANYGAGRLLFLQDRFSTEARDLALNFESVKQLAGRYQNSIQSTFWRMVEDRDPGLATFGVISVHPHHPTVGQHNGTHPCRYFIRSAAFRSQFAGYSPDEAYASITRLATRRKAGPVCCEEDIIKDVLDQDWVFRIESFSTGHALLTIGAPVGRRSVLVAGSSELTR